MAMVVVSLGELLRDSGLTVSALRAGSLTNHQASNLFWLNTALGLGFGTAIVLASPILAVIFDDDRLLSVVPVLAVILLFNGIGAQVTVQLSRAQRYVTISLTDVLSQAVALGLAILAALSGWGYNALLIQYVGASLLLVVSRWLMCRWIPALPQRRTGSKLLVTSGMEYAASQFLGYAATNVDTFVIGARWGATPLGHYNRAFQLLMTPLTRILGPLTNVAVPTLTMVKNAGRSTEDYLLKLQVVLVLPTVLMFAVTAGAADTLIPLLLGGNWQETIVLFQILAIGGAFRGLSHLCYWAFLTIGTSREFLKVSVVTKTFTIALVIAAAFTSVEGVAWACVVGMIVGWVVTLWWLNRTTGLAWGRFVANGLRLVAIGLPAAVAAWAASAYLSVDHLFVDALIQCIIGVLVYLCILIIIPGGRKDLLVCISLTRNLAARR